MTFDTLIRLRLGLTRLLARKDVMMMMMMMMMMMIHLKRGKKNLSRSFLASRAWENVVFAIWVKEGGSSLLLDLRYKGPRKAKISPIRHSRGTGEADLRESQSTIPSRLVFAFALLF